MKYLKLYEDFLTDLANQIVDATSGMGTDEESLVKAIGNIQSVEDLVKLNAAIKANPKSEYQTVKDAVDQELGMFDNTEKDLINKKFTKLGIPNYLKDGIIPQNKIVTKTETDHTSANPNRIMVCAHAAKWDGAGASSAENCLTNVKANVANGTDMIEIDIQITSDGVPVLFHDESLNSKTNGTGKIQDLTWDQVSKIKYNSDPTQTICSLEQVVSVIKEASSSIILQLDKCDSGELAIISKLGLLNGMGGQVIAKGSSSSAPGIVNSMGISWMQILSTSDVGQVTTSEYADSVVKKIGAKFFEYQFSDSDEYITNGYLSKALNDKGIKTLVVAVGGTENTNGASYRGDSSSAWKKIINDINPNIIMTNRPSQLLK